MVSLTTCDLGDLLGKSIEVEVCDSGSISAHIRLSDCVLHVIVERDEFEMICEGLNDFLSKEMEG